LALISEETILEVKRSTDITEIVRGYIPLKRSGSNYKALCPFHDEKTPSFNVNPERQYFTCFGCGKKGDAITFVIEMEKVEYPEAIRILADKAGLTIKYSGGEIPGTDRRELAQVNEWAAGVFRGLLKSAPEAEVARKFLSRRGVGEEAAETFGLGYSMDSWDHLVGRARRNGISEKALVGAGLAVEREGKLGCYDRFRGRLMFPILSPQGRPIAFGARTLKDDEHPKFINSPETAVFSKGRGFYGLSLAKEALEETRTAYIVEGYLDVIVPYQAGIRGLVATLGTALTRDHLKILRRYADKVVLVFDADQAGQKASERGLDLLLSENMDLFVAELPPGMDPDDVVLKRGPEALWECLKKPREIFDFLMTSLSARHGVETPAAKGRIVEEMIDRLGQIPDPVKQEILLQALAAKFGLEERTLRGKLARKAEDPAAPAGAPETARPAAPEVLAVHESAARDLLACMLADPASAARVRHEVALLRYPTELLRQLAEQAYRRFDETGQVSGRDFVRGDSRALGDLAVEVARIEIPAEEASGRIEAALLTLGQEEARAEARDRRARLKNATPDQETEVLRQAMDARRKSPRDHRRLPGR
jgi:DNA primase